MAPPDRRLKEILTKLEALERRVSALERGPAAFSEPTAGAASGSSLKPARAPDGSRAPEHTLKVLLPLLGRTFLVLGGAFLIRALTERQVLPQAAGTAAGIGYALFWAILCLRARAAWRHLSSHFHGAAVTLISMPLLWEATVRFRFLPPAAGAAAMAAAAAALLGLAWHTGYRALAWFNACLIPPVVFSTGVGTARLDLFSACLVFVAAAATAVRSHRKWFGLATVPLFFAFGSVATAALIFAKAPASAPAAELGLRSLLALQYLVVLAAFAGYAVPALRAGRPLRAGEIAAAAAATSVGLGGAGLLLSAGGLSLVWVAFPAIALSALCYLAAYVYLDDDRGRTFRFFSAMAGLLGALGVFLRPRLRDLAFPLLSVVAVWAGRKLKRSSLSLHALAFLLLGAVTSGFLAATGNAFLGRAPAPADWLDRRVLLFAAGLAVAYPLLPLPKPGEPFQWKTARIGWLLALLCAAGGTLIAFLAPAPAPEAAPLPGAGTLAALRTAVLAVAAGLTAWAGRWSRTAELRWFAYPILVAGGIKLVAEDFRAGSALTLFLSLAVYGVALILTPRLRKAPD